MTVGRPCGQARGLVVCNRSPTSATCASRENGYEWAVAWLRPCKNGTVIQWVFKGEIVHYVEHFDGNNYLFCDTHVKFLKASMELTDPNDPFWNFDDKQYVKWP